MCLATVYIEDNGQKEEVMRDVAWIEHEGPKVLLVNMMGERKLFQARIKSVNLMKRLLSKRY